MNFELSDEHKMIQQMASDFADEKIAPFAEEIDKHDDFDIVRQILEQMGELGWLGITIPEVYGGSEAGYFAHVLIAEQVGRASCGVADSYVVQSNLVIDNLNRNGNDDQKKKYLPVLCSGKKIGALGITEPGAGSDAMSMQLRAVKQGDHYILNGSKIFITNGPEVDTQLVYAKTDPAKGAKGISAFIVEKGTNGFSTSRKIEKLGHKGAPFGELVFEECIVPAENLVGKENEGFRIVMSGLDKERIIWTSPALGLAVAAFKAALQYSKERKQFGQIIGSFQMIQERLADMALEIEAGRLLLYKAATLADEGRDISLASSFAKLYVSEMSERVTSKALHIFGGYGYTTEFPLERYFRDAKCFTIGAGTSDVQRIIISRHFLK
jgi:isovaleryl-CoA dehydrogenase